ncbi:MAG: MFS transporter [Candidatus Obscuribacterales bacterium]|nr:MFS transporter [Candidatus Obscuribacterales bacterium]
MRTNADTSRLPGPRAGALEKSPDRRPTADPRRGESLAAGQPDTNGRLVVDWSRFMKSRLNLLQIWNMNFGFLGIQFGWGLQLANMSAIYTKLGADPDKIPILWLAGPVTGLLVQPIIGAMSDRTWNRLGRRRPYFLTGAILSSIALCFMPESPELWIAASLLWVLDACINISMEPFRAFVADKLIQEQRTLGFIMQSFFIGIGATMANALPRIFRELGVTGTAPNGVPLTVLYSFRIGAAMFLLCVLWTVFTSSEYPPEDMDEFNKKRSENPGLGGLLKEVFAEIPVAIKSMPSTMKQLALVQVFTWLGLFSMWLYFGLMCAYHVFKAPSSQSELFDRGIEWAGWCFAVYSIVCFLVAFILPKIAQRTSRKLVHSIALTLGGLSLLSTYFITDANTLQWTMIGVGIAWSSILSIPYAILSTALPANRMGVFMGVFNFFIVIPEIIASLAFQPLVKNVFHNDPLYVVMMGGACLLVAAVLVVRVDDTNESNPTGDAQLTGSH